MSFFVGGFSEFTVSGHFIYYWFFAVYYCFWLFLCFEVCVCVPTHVHVVCILCFLFVNFYYYYDLFSCFLKKTKGRRHWVGWVGRWGESGRSEGRKPWSNHSVWKICVLNENKHINSSGNCSPYSSEGWAFAVSCFFCCLKHPNFIDCFILHIIHTELNFSIVSFYRLQFP